MKAYFFWPKSVLPYNSRVLLPIDVSPKGGSEVVEKHGVFAIGGAPAYPFSRAGAPYLIAVPGRIGPAGLPMQKPTPSPLAAASAFL